MQPIKHQCNQPPIPKGILDSSTPLKFIMAPENQFREKQIPIP